MNLLYPVLGIGVLVVFHKKIYEDWLFFRSRPKQWARLKWKNWGEPLLVAAIFAIVIRTFLLGPYKIPTGSMRPTFMEGDRIFVDKVSYRFKEPERGDIIVFKYPVDMKKDFVKRLVGMPGDTVEILEGMIYVNGEKLEEPPFSEHYYYNVSDTFFGERGEVIRVPQHNFLVLGDNSAHSSDSRYWGFVPDKNLVGRAFLIWWPPNRVKLVD